MTDENFGSLGWFGFRKKRLEPTDRIGPITVSVGDEDPLLLIGLPNWLGFLMMPRSEADERIYEACVEALRRYPRRAPVALMWYPAPNSWPQTTKFVLDFFMGIGMPEGPNILVPRIFKEQCGRRLDEHGLPPMELVG